MKTIPSILLIFHIILLTSNIQAQNNESTILNILNEQAKAWSDNNIEAFMEGYWKNDSLKFYGANGVTYGWQNTLDNYKKRYPSKEHMGKLNFEIKSITKISNYAYYVMGEYFLKRTIGDANGIFMIIFKKLNGEWKIVADTSC